ncbi:MAG: hypothetical protein CMB99_05425 [Flavobacteriaceae bacterium]|nr:hypothetical protein [Flavobacteriaceae bacterium]|tara:strand:+ start:15881 stop:16201 length:321 start_codon:yes stop_codon:yes gene_type:complete
MVKKLLFFVFLFVAAVSFAQQNSLKNLSASPNPFKNQTNISFYNNDAGKVILSVQNVLGKIVYRETFSAKHGKNTITFYKNNLNKGVYLYSIQKQSGILTKRFVIQ